jgi:uncharacterized membrane protein YfbV (UPF0208 family)
LQGYFSELLRADPLKENISDVLVENRVTNVGRFSVEYRDLFAEVP